VGFGFGGVVGFGAGDGGVVVFSGVAVFESGAAVFAGEVAVSVGAAAVSVGGGAPPPRSSGVTGVSSEPLKTPAPQRSATTLRSPTMPAAPRMRPLLPPPRAERGGGVGTPPGVAYEWLPGGEYGGTAAAGATWASGGAFAVPPAGDGGP